MRRTLLLLLVTVLVVTAAGPVSGASAAFTFPKVSSNVGEQPRIGKARDAAPKRLKEKDVVVGKGRTARPGDLVTAHYAGVLYGNGRAFDASWGRGEPFRFQLGAGMVIPGWDRGVKGMRVGGRRLLVIPPRLAYGATGSPPAIPPGATLTFVVDLVRVSR